MKKENLRFEDLTTEQKLGMVCCARPMKDEHIGYAIELIKKALPWQHSAVCEEAPPYGAGAGGC